MTVQRVHINRKNRVYESKGEPLFQGVLIVFFILLSITFIYPYWHVLVNSFTTPAYASASGFRLWPREFTIDAYTRMFNTTYLWSGYLNTLKVCAMGWALSITGVILCAYPLSKRDLPLRNVFTLYIVLTMFLKGGMIPTYLLVNNTLHLRNSFLAVVLPQCVTTTYVIIARNYLMTLPIELEEAATIDGANSWQVLWRVILPLSTPILATISMWVLIGNWNAYFNCLLYITDSKKFVLQVVLRRIILTDSVEMTAASEAIKDSTVTDPVTLRAASIMLATLPIICVYPFLQKYFVKGMLIGSLKG
ncbi:MAG: carbohydrate ABC transporter permease [Oscillospiraceae bacterium]|nr:carbohydrate ABC transporter permease [Oscillospiraceae bacterium]